MPEAVKLLVITGALIPFPWIAKVYGFSLLSLFAILIVAVLKPSADGSKVTWKVVLPGPAILLEGIAVTVKSAALVPEIVKYGLAPVKLKAAVPVFWMVNVLTIVPEAVETAPKSVWSAKAGDTSPETIETAFPWRLISGEAADKLPLIIKSSILKVPVPAASPVAGVPSASPPVKTNLITVFALLSKASIDVKSADRATQTPFPLVKVEPKSVKTPPVPVELYWTLKFNGPVPEDLTLKVIVVML